MEDNRRSGLKFLAKLEVPVFRRFLRFRIRFLFVLVVLSAIGMVVYLHFWRVHERIVDNHYQTYLNAASAIEIQRPKVDKYWRSSYSIGSSEYGRWFSGLKMDRSTLSKARPLWEKAMEHARLRDYNLRLQDDWTNVFSVMPSTRIPELPQADAELPQWWLDNIEPFVKKNELNASFMENSRDPEWLRFDIEIINNEPYDVVKKFFDLREVVGGRLQ